MKILVIISRDLEKASAIYRVGQYQDLLRQRGIDLEFVKKAAIDRDQISRLNGYDALFNQKCLINGSRSKALIDRSRRVIFDFDDAIYTRPNRQHSFLTGIRVKSRLRYWLESSDVVTASSNWLAEYARRFTNEVVVVPMALDLQRWRPRAPGDAGRIRIGWAGAPGNLPYIEHLDPILTRLLHDHPNVELAIYSGRRPTMTCPYVYQPFVAGEEHRFTQTLDIGLLPLPDDAFTLGKSPVKAVQYLACAVPVVGNIRGAAAEMLNPTNSIAVSTDDDWLRALRELIADASRRTALGQAGRRLIEARHDRKVTVGRLAAILTGQDRQARSVTPVTEVPQFALR